MRMGNQLDRCKMARYQSERITLTELIDREQDHTVIIDEHHHRDDDAVCSH